MEKVGRNDPCPCGSGKKYKQCCMLKEGQDKGAAKYTSGGKRKFKASVIKLEPGSVSLFQKANAAVQSSSQEALEALKFPMTDLDFRVFYDPKSEDLLTPYLLQTPDPEPNLKGFSLPSDIFVPTTEDFRI